MHSEKATSIFGIQARLPHSSPEMMDRCWAQTGQVIPQRWMKTCSGTGCLGRSFSAQNSACSWQGTGIQGRVTQWGTPIGCGHLQCPRKITCICFVLFEETWGGVTWKECRSLARRTGKTGCGDVTIQTSQGSWDKGEGKGRFLELRARFNWEDGHEMKREIKGRSKEIGGEMSLLWDTSDFRG